MQTHKIDVYKVENEIVTRAHSYKKLGQIMVSNWLEAITWHLVFYIETATTGKKYRIGLQLWFSILKQVNFFPFSCG